MKKAAEEERRLAIAERNIENGVPYITVVVDGGLLQEDRLFEEIQKCVDNVIRKADRLQKNVTTNYAERYMSLITKFSGRKGVNYTTGGSYKRKCIETPLAYNLGLSWHLALMNKSHLNKFCERRTITITKDRIAEKARRQQPQNTDLHYGPNAQAALPDLPEEEFKSNMAKKLADWK
ncbi:hypothetical protein ILUMI_18740 [Ignelater luminosus]|uniref:Uncharacterized protein n=1 Tax=Ignelater luminosus TaxID=2038154 RepID=A0A8K0CLI1_IGNLU|nr:hypothetical protein ILUMI_18740 [Ignelater luminosus]